MARMSWKTLLALIVGLALILVAPSSVQAQSGVQYVYDELGRLVGVIDPTGNAAAYSYDPVGNLLSISRYTPTQVSIIQFTPKSGPIGTTVTISGTGFSTTASQNTITFNGTSATVTSATANQLVTSVPSSATTGPIGVTSPNGSVTSSTAFTITASSGAPTISSFTPTIGAPGTAVTVTGSNFDLVPANDKLNFNVIPATNSSATTTNLSTTVPAGGTSGRLALSTPGGSTTSSSDFFVPPSPHVASDVVFTARMTIGGSSTVTINTASKIGLIVFDGTAGQSISLTATNVTITLAGVTIFTPAGATLVFTYLSSGSNFIDALTLPTTGTYTIMVAPTSTYTGNMTLNLYNVVDVTGTITPGGSAVTVTTTIPGQNARLTFTGSAGQRVSLYIQNVTIPSSNNAVSILKPDGTTLASVGVYPPSSNTFFIDTQTLPVAGTYTVFVNPWAANVGSATLTLYNVPADFTGTIAIGGSAVTITTTVRGQNAQLTFSGTAGQQVSLQITNVNFVNYSTSNITIYNPNGTTLGSTTASSSGGFIADLNLSTTGTYTIFIDPQGIATGSMALTLYNTADQTGTITPGGSPVTVTINTPGQDARLTFSGTAGQKVSLQVQNATCSSCNVSILKPDGTTLATIGTGAGYTWFMDTQTLPVTGTYAVFVDPSGTNTGSLTLTLFNVVDVTGSVTVGGSSLGVTITTPGQNAQITFSGTAGQQVTVHFTSNTISTVSVSLLDPSGRSLTSLSFQSGSSFNLASQTLSTTGTYTIFIDPYSLNTGGITVNVTSP